MGMLILTACACSEVEIFALTKKKQVVGVKKASELAQILNLLKFDFIVPLQYEITMEVNGAKLTGRQLWQIADSGLMAYNEYGKKSQVVIEEQL
jgi:hypothetical protein